ncbi:MAG: hypothetical protein Q4F24_01535 [Eubacteriales bacterium]|nr:hypothetical protein [Eubacteriales bacterium]
MRKKTWLLGCALTILLCGCGNSEQTSAAQKPQVTEAAETETAAPTPTEEQETGGEVTGKILNFTGSILSLQVEGEDNSVEFEIGDGKLKCQNGILAGEEVVVSYEGERKEGDITKAKVLEVSDAPGREELEETVIAGQIQAVTNNTLTIATEENVSITFVTTGARYELKQGLTLGNWVDVSYKGEMIGSNVRNLKVLSVTDSNDLEETEELSSEDVQEMNATLLSVQNDILTVQEKEGEQYQFSASHAQISLRYGVLEESEVILTYCGEASADASSSELKSVVDEDPKVVNEETGGFSVTGTVMVCGSNVLTVMSNDGAQITCAIEEAQIDLDREPALGDYVKIVVKPNKKSNVYQVLKIASAFSQE